MGFWTLMEGLLLFANALAILNEDRFLAPKDGRSLNSTKPTKETLLEAKSLLVSSMLTIT
ncbi:predicted protein [Arabidopsis lyrata subsp. lyrata]|uniref:Predicted protein n=1 Tax=Arabidopsis lyrata subsp. lyrata TaxID=81972 RepID=D7MNT7_ARALL|nr:predicted protein [Arabidopsis lyrata subsp. lyrata]